MTVIRAVGTVLTLSMHREAPSATSHEARDVLDGSRAPVTRASRERGHMTGLLATCSRPMGTIAGQLATDPVGFGLLAFR